VILARPAFTLAVLAATFTACSGGSAAVPASTPVTADPNADYEAASYRACSQAWRSGSVALNDSIGGFASVYAHSSASKDADPAKWQAAYDGCARGLAVFLSRP
jgi:hypothetical protein